MAVKLPTEKNFEFLSLFGGCTGSSESIHIKIPHSWDTLYGIAKYSLMTIIVIINAAIF